MTKELEEQFNTSRIPFAIVNDKLQFTIFDKRNHKTWLKEVYNVSEEDFEDLIRGYMKDGKLYFYSTSQFRPVNMTVIPTSILSHLHILAMVYMSTGNVDCYNGLKVDDSKDIYEPLVKLGKLSEMIIQRERSFCI